MFVHEYVVEVPQLRSTFQVAPSLISHLTWYRPVPPVTAAVNVMFAPGACGVPRLLVSHRIVTGPDVGAGDDTGADGADTGGGAVDVVVETASRTLNGTDVFTLLTSAVVVESRAQTATRLPPAAVGLHVYVLEELQLRMTVHVVPSKTKNLN